MTESGDPSDSLILNLQDNAHDFVRRSLIHVRNTDIDPREWKYAIATLAMAVELLLKSALAKEHRLFVYESIDSPDKSVTPRTAIQRLESILGHRMRERDRQYLDNVFRWRNEILHSEMNLHLPKVRGNYFLIVSWLNQFHNQIFGSPLSSVDLEGEWKVLLNHNRYVAEAIHRFQEEFEAGRLGLEEARNCPRCSQATYLLSPDLNICFLCGFEELIEECGECGELSFSDDLLEVDFGNLKRIEWIESRCIGCFRELVEGRGYYGEVTYVPAIHADEVEEIEQAAEWERDDDWTEEP